MRVVPLEAFRDKIPFAVAVGAVERGFRALGLGEATLPDPLVMELPAQQAEVHVKGAHLRGGRHIVLKLATGFYRNRARGLPSGDGMFLLLDAETGLPDRRGRGADPQISRAPRCRGGAARGRGSARPAHGARDDRRAAARAAHAVEPEPRAG